MSEKRTHAIDRVKQVVVTGNPVDGFTFYGPFEGVDEAEQWADTNLKWPDWLVAPCNEPVLLDTDAQEGEST